MLRMEQALHDGPSSLGRRGQFFRLPAGQGDWPKGMASDALGAQDALEMRAVIQSLADVIIVKREQQAAFRKQFAWPSLCHSMLWSAGAFLGLPRWTDDARPHDGARERDLVQSHSAILAAAVPCSTSDPPALPLEVKAVAVGPARQQQGHQAAKRRRRPVLLAGRADYAAGHLRGFGNYGSRTQEPPKTHRRNYGRRTLEPDRSHWAFRNYGRRTQGPKKSLRAQKCEGSRTQVPARNTGPSGPLSPPASSPCRCHGWGGGFSWTEGKATDWSSGQNGQSGSDAPSPLVSLGFRLSTPPVAPSASTDSMCTQASWSRCASPLQVVLDSRPLACALVPSCQPAFVHASMLSAGFRQDPTGAPCHFLEAPGEDACFKAGMQWPGPEPTCVAAPAALTRESEGSLLTCVHLPREATSESLGWTTTSRAAPYKVSAVPPKHVCHFPDSIARAAPSVAGEGGAATPEYASVNVYETRTPRTASRAQVSCWTPFESLLAGDCISGCSHAVWRGLGSMLHNALRSARIGEASHPGPFQQPSLQGDFDPPPWGAHWGGGQSWA